MELVAVAKRMFGPWVPWRSEDAVLRARIRRLSTMGLVGLRKENMSEHVDFDVELGIMIFTFEEKIRLPQTNG